MRRPFETGSQFYQRMQDGKAAKRERDAQQPAPVPSPEKRTFTPVRKPAPQPATPETKGVLAVLPLPPEPKPAA